MSSLFNKGMGRTALRLALLCAAMGSAHASSPIIAQTSIALSNVHFEFIDLNTNDAVLPSVNFQSLGLFGDLSYTDGLLPSSPISYVSPTGQANVALDSTSALLQTHVTLDQLLNQVPATTPQQLSISTSGDGTYLNVGDLSPELFQTFTLTPSTLMIVRGSMSVNASLDSATLRNEIANLGYTAWTLSMGDSAVMGQIGMAQALEGDDGLFSLSQGNLYGTSMPTYGLLTDADASDTWSYTSTQDFEFVLANVHTETMNGVFMLNLNASSAAYLSAERPFTPAVPEPSTYALMGLGLLGIMAARRRQH